MRTRFGCRVVLLDPADRLLLLRIEDPIGVIVEGVPSPPSYWVTTGGGLEDGESFEQAARREVLEETGIQDLALGPALLDRDLQVVLQGEPMRLFERCFAGWTPEVEVSFGGHTELEQRVVKEHRWWTRDELASPAAPPCFPEKLLDLFDRSRSLRVRGW